MKYTENIQAVAALEPDYLGFIFWSPSKRFYQGNIPVLPPSIKKVGVFVDSSISEIVDLVERHDLYAVQLHGTESSQFCRLLKEHLKTLTKRRNGNLDSSIKIIKVFGVDKNFDLAILNEFEPVADFYLFDTKGPLPGGNGYGFDWELLESYKGSKPFFLSGGIGPEDEVKLKKFLSSPASLHCHALDVNSKFEERPGLKDIESLRTFIKNHRGGFRSPEA
ncbi:MAG: phosphoribosylanthranilate isomerase [Sediminicola sp.]